MEAGEYEYEEDEDQKEEEEEEQNPFISAIIQGNSIASIQSVDLADKPLVAMLLEPKSTLLAHLDIIAQAEVEFDENPMVLALITNTTASTSVMRNLYIVEQKIFCAMPAEQRPEGTWMWPLHPDHATRIGFFCVDILSDKDEQFSVCARILYGLRIWEPPRFVRFLRNHHGPQVAYTFEWSYFYTRALWLLAPLCAVMACFGGDQDKLDFYNKGWLWRIFKVCLAAWGFTVALVQRKNKLWIMATDTIKPLEDKHEDELNPYYEEIPEGEQRKLYLVYVFFVLPVIGLFLAVILLILLTVIQLNFWLTYVWGECLLLGCRDPQEKRGFGGWAAEVGSDVLLAIIFEGLLAVNGLVAEWAVSFLNIKTVPEFRATLRMHLVVLECIGKIFPYMIIAWLISSDWCPSEDKEFPLTEWPEEKCAGTFGYDFWGCASFHCLQIVMPREERRFLLYRAMKGPFIVAPFIGILVKVIIPWVAYQLDLWSRGCQCCCKCLEDVFDGIARILGLIFVYDCGMVGGPGFAVNGWPYSKVRLVSRTQQVRVDRTPRQASMDEDEAMTASLQNALEQGARKPFEAKDELLEIQLNFLWVLFFAPVRPAGIIPTVIARVLETHSDLLKLLFVRRRVFPKEAFSLQDVMRHFLMGTATFATVWLFSLSLVTYNNDLWKWYQDFGGQCT